MTLTVDQMPSIDVRDIPHGERHPRIFGMLNSLAPGGAVLLTVDHDPVPLRYHLESMFSGMFGWEYLQRGPDLWRVEIARLKHDGCNCNCGGGHS
ncbi:DUF2249 domain-containing protein [Rhizobium sp. RU36D]|uniref:DUF2249 domain-containing protein n=1 Tax=Rhizobium sp. RU36D TaxID=1907415 RepID=UPI0009D7B57F|nr:DUF2249 domain-containing protein [Rhizobium sp. RU36D]SMC73505.1 Uncharacterized conserved protein, DUF2249 family [Rhizobium sp. RU36D]